MVQLGAIEAMNLDGGGSATMVVGGRIVNEPSDGRERPIGSALLVLRAGP
jgi:exopolysaccharide biosynthesis protein